MKAANIAPLKLDLFRAIDKMKERELKAIHQFVISDKKQDFYDMLEDWQKEDIDAGLKDIKEGKTKNVAEFLKSI